MFETFRKLMYFGLGAAAMSTDKFKQFIDELVAKGDVTSDEGKKLLDEFSAKMEEEGKSVNDRIKIQVQNIMRDMGMVDKATFAMLEARIAALERRIEAAPMAESEPASMEDIGPAL